MSGYLSGSTSLSVTDKCWVGEYYGHSATASASVSVDAGSNTASYSITVTTSNYNYIQIYLKIGDTVVRNEKDTGGKKTYLYSGTTTISGGSIAVELGVGCSQYTSSAMTYTSSTLSRTWWGDPSAPTMEIIDNGNNTATIRGNLGQNGTNNGMTGSTLFWTTNGNEPADGSWYTSKESMGKTSGGAYSKTIDIPDGCTTIKAVTYCYFTYTNNTNTGHRTQSVKHYKAPGNPGKPSIIYTKSRLTNRENWTLKWTAASAGNSNSPVIGYRVRLAKKGPNDSNWRWAPFKNASGTTITTVGGSTSNGTDYYYDTESTAVSLTIKPDGAMPGDIYWVGLYAYSKNGAGSTLWSGNGTNIIWSDEYKVRNSGIMRIKHNNTWKEGIVFIKVGNTWKEAESVHIKVGSSWKESE